MQQQLMDEFASLPNSQSLERNPAKQKRTKTSPECALEPRGFDTPRSPGRTLEGKSKVSINLEKNQTRVIHKDSHQPVAPPQITPAFAQTKIHETQEVLRQVAETINESELIARDLIGGNGLSHDGPRPLEGKALRALESARHTYAAAHAATHACSTVGALHPQLATEISALSRSVARVAEDVAQTAVSLLETVAGQASTATKIRWTRSAIVETGAQLRTAQQLMRTLKASVGTPIDPTMRKTLPALALASKAYSAAHLACKHATESYNEVLAVVKPLEASRGLKKQKQLAELRLQPVLQKMIQQQKKSAALLQIPGAAANTQTIRYIGQLLDDFDPDVAMPDSSELSLRKSDFG